MPLHFNNSPLSSARDASPEEGGRSHACANFGFAIVFVVHVICLHFLRNDDVRDQPVCTDAVLRTGSLVIGIGTVVGGLWLVMLLRYSSPANLLQKSYPVSCVLWITVSAFFWQHASYWAGSLCFLLAIGDTVWIIQSRRKLEFTRALLDTVADTYKWQMHIVGAGLLCLVVQVLYILYWINVFADNFCGTFSSGSAFAFVFLLISLRWSTAFLQNIFSSYICQDFCIRLQVNAEIEQSTALSESEDFTFDQGIDQIDNPSTSTQAQDRFDNNSEATNKSLVRLWINSFGTLAAGSLVGILNPILWSLLRVLRGLNARSQSHRIICCSRSVGKFVQRWLRMSHRYTIVWVAKYNTPWFRAARTTWDALSKDGNQAVIADDATDRLNQFSCYVAGLGGILLAWQLSSPLEYWQNPLLVVILFYLGYSCVALQLALLNACVMTLIVTFATHPRQLAQWHTIVYHRFSRLAETHQVRFHADFSPIHERPVADVDSIAEEQSAT